MAANRLAEAEDRPLAVDDSPGCGARCRLRPLMRSLRGAARTPNRRTSLSELLGCDSSLTPPLCQTCGDPLATWRAIDIQAEKCPRCRRRKVGDRASSSDRRLRWTAARNRACSEIRRPTILAPRLAALMRARCSEVLAGSFCVVPVPLHSSRRRERGFNQAVDLAEVPR